MANAQASADARDKTFRIVAYVAQFFFGGWFLYNGLNFFIQFFPQPTGSSPLSRELIGALIHSGMFAVVKGIEVVVGVALLANRFTALAAVLAFPVTYSIAHLNIVANGDAFSIGTGIVFTTLNGLIALGQLDRFLPMLAFNTGDPSAAGLRTFFSNGGTTPSRSAMGPMVHALCILAGLAAPLAVEAWTTSPMGPRSKAHYAAVAQVSMNARDTALAFDKLVFDEGNPQEAAARFLSPDLADHASNAEGGRGSIVSLVRNGQLPQGLQRSIRHVAAEADVVMIHYDLTASDGAETSIVDIFRIKEGKIVEHWDVLQSASTALPGPG
jgi:predicted SnoaL-like aldol condensation-catalyzing enzyme